MRIRLGSTSLKTLNSDRIPNNYGMAEHANAEIDSVVDAANTQYEEALKVDGVAFMLWRKTKEGRRCTCKEPTIETSYVDSRFEEFNTPKTTPRPPSAEAITVRSSWDKQKTKKNEFGTELGVTIGKIENDDGSDVQEIRKFDPIDKNELEDFLASPADNHFLNSGEATTACGICFGTGYTNGYSLYKGYRYTLDTINVKKRSGFVVNKDTRPFSFTTSGEQKGQYIEWEWEQPAIFENCLSVNIRNNLDPADNLKISVLHEGAYVPFTPAFVNTQKGDSRIYSLRVSTADDTDNRDIVFTHVEYVLQFNPWDYVQVGQLNESRNFNTAEPVSELEFNLTPRIDRVKNGDVIFETKYNKVWVISNTTDLQTANHKLINWTVSGRSTTSMDIIGLLQLAKKPYYSLSYKGLDGDDEY